MSAFKTFGPCVVLGTLVLGTLAVLSASPKADADRIALVFAPWTSRHDVLRALDGHDLRIVRGGWNDSVLIVDISADPGQRAVLAEKALFLASALVAGTCIGWPDPNQTVGDT